MFEYEINRKFLAFILLIIFLAFAIFPSFIISFIMHPFGIEDTNETYLKRLVTDNPNLIENIKSNPEVVKALIDNDTSELRKEVIVTKIVTPTPDGKLYFAGEYQNGTRMLNHPFSIYRGYDGKFIPNNVNKNSTFKFSINVYDYAIFNTLHFFDIEYTDSPSGKGYVTQYPYDENNVFLILFVSIYSDEVISKNTQSIWLPNQTYFKVWYNNTIFNPQTEYPQQLRIRELERTVNSNGDSYIQAFGQNVYKSKKITIDSSNDESNDNTDIVGYKSIKQYYIPSGLSNIEDGYIIYEIPRNANINDIMVNFGYGSFGYSSWKLYNEDSNYYKLLKNENKIGGF